MEKTERWNFEEQDRVGNRKLFDKQIKKTGKLLR